MPDNVHRHSDDLDDIPFWLLPKKSQQKKGEEAVTARYESRKNMCSTHFTALRLIDGKCDSCE